MRPTAAATKPSFFLARYQLVPASSRAAAGVAAADDTCKSRRTGRSWRAASAGSNGADERGQSVSTVATTTSGRRARLSARRRESIRLLDVLPGQDGAAGGIGEFLRHPAGMESLLNTRALQSFAPVESDSGPDGAFRCTLHPMGFLGFQVAPVLDLRVIPTRDDCTVEMLSCRFEGSDSIEQQNELFSAVMTNRITWGDNGDQEPCLDIDVNLEVTLEVYTKPFSLLPLSAVEKPGNLKLAFERMTLKRASNASIYTSCATEFHLFQKLMQGLLDRLVPMLGEQLLRDYHSWVQQQTQPSSS